MSVSEKIRTKIYGRIEEMNQTQPPWLVNNNTKRNSNNKEAYTYRSKSTGRKVDYDAVFTDFTRRGTLPGEASIHRAEMTAMKKVKNRKNVR